MLRVGFEPKRQKKEDLPTPRSSPFDCPNDVLNVSPPAPPPLSDNSPDASKLDMRNFKKPTTHDAHKNSQEEEKRASKSAMAASNGHAVASKN